MTFEHKFTQAGTFAYHCIPHGSAMTGTIVVQ
jgi:plastocyanin